MKPVMKQDKTGRVLVLYEYFVNFAVLVEKTDDKVSVEGVKAEIAAPNSTQAQPIKIEGKIS